MPQKTWAVGEEVLAADFNTYLQKQVVPQFPNVAARDAWAGPPKGALCVTTDTNALWIYSGAAWQSLPRSVAGVHANTVPNGSPGLSGQPVNFGATFTAAPILVGGIMAVSNVDLVLNWQTVTTTGFTYRVYTNALGNVPGNIPISVYWLAIGTLA